MLRSWPRGTPLFLFITRDCHGLPSPQCHPDPHSVYLLRSYCILPTLFHRHRFIRLTYLMPRFVLIVCTIVP